MGWNGVKPMSPLGWTGVTWGVSGVEWGENGGWGWSGRLKAQAEGRKAGFAEFRSFDSRLLHPCKPKPSLPGTPIRRSLTMTICCAANFHPAKPTAGSSGTPVCAAQHSTNCDPLPTGLGLGLGDAWVTQGPRKGHPGVTQESPKGRFG
jgi:hypothetical protein